MQGLLMLEAGDAPACQRLTVANFATVKRDIGHLPEFAFSPKGRIEPMQPIAKPDRATQAWHGPMLPAKRLTRKVVRFGHDVWIAVGPRKVDLAPVIVRNAEDTRDLHLGYAEIEGKADPIWDTAFALKNKKKVVDPQKPLVTPSGRVDPLKDFLDKQEELRWLAETQHRISRDGQQSDLDIATTYETFKANGIAVLTPRVDDDDPDHSDEHVNLTPYCVRLPDGSYGDQVYIAAMRRNIAWEKWLHACGQVERAFFAVAKDGSFNILAGTRNRDPEYVNALRRAAKYRWLDSHANLPTTSEVAQAKEATTGVRAIDRLTPDERAEYDASRLFGNEDDDPWRNEFHADPDPKPLREQYAEGGCTVRCPDFPWEDGHNGCTIDGWDQFHADVALWTAHQIALDPHFVEYAGPSGQLGVDESTPFEEDEDEFE